VVVLLALTLGACAQKNTPTEYNTLTNQNFLESCTNYYFDNTNDTLAQTGNTVKADVTAPDQPTCQCQYEIFVNQMPINSSAAKAQAGYSGPNFTDLNAQLKTDPQKAWDTVPDTIKSAINDCTNSSGTSQSTTTTVAGDQTTTTGAGDTTTTG